MCTFATNRKGASFQMTCGLLQNIFFCGVVDRELDIDLWDLYNSHHLITGNVQCVHVGLVFFTGICNGERVRKDTWK